MAPITAQEMRPVAEFLHRHLNRRLSPDAWARAMAVPWKVNAPNHGFLLADGDAIAGVYLAFYSERTIDGQPERFCNLGPWCVLPGQRFHSVRLLKALLAQPGYHFTDLSPSGNVIGINQRLGFTRLDPATALVPNLPWPSWPGRNGSISADPAVIEQTLTGAELDLYYDHERTQAARHLVLRRGEAHCYVVFRKDRRKGLPVFATFLHVGNPRLFARMARPLARHLLLRHGALASLAEVRMLGHRPQPSLLLSVHRPKMFRSQRLRPEQISYLYSELTCVAW